MNDITPNLGLPMLQAGQAQKEITHNEALTLLDMAVHAVVAEAATAEPPAAPTPGRCWIVGADAGDAWLDRQGALAGWTAGGWRFVAPVEGMRVWSEGDGVYLSYRKGRWVAGEVVGTRIVIGGEQVVGARQPGIDPPAGGGVIDAEARNTIAAILAALTAHGLLG